MEGENDFFNIIEMLIMPAIVLLESIDTGGSQKAESAKAGFSGLDELFMLIALPAFIPFMEMANPHHGGGGGHGSGGHGGGKKKD
jgi:hypothetical protein